MCVGYSLNYRHIVFLVGWKWLEGRDGKECVCDENDFLSRLGKRMKRRGKERRLRYGPFGFLSLREFEERRELRLNVLSIST